MNFVYNIDLKDFFHSFPFQKIKWALLSEFFPEKKLYKKKEDVCFLITRLVTHPFEVNYQTIKTLPQGAPTSPTLTNIICKKLDKRLHQFASNHNLNYTRYADDITFSGVYQFVDEKFKNRLNKIIETDQKLKINDKKTRLQYKTYKQEVTGLTVNQKINVSQNYIKQIRQWLYLFERFGAFKAESIILKEYQANKGHLKKGKPNIENIIHGKLLYLKMVRGQEDALYQKLDQRYKIIFNQEQQSQVIPDKNKNKSWQAMVDELVLRLNT